MSAIDPSSNVFPFVSKEFALTGDTNDLHYSSFDILQTDTFVDILKAHISMDTTHQQEEAEYHGPIPIVDLITTAMQTY